MMTFTQVAMLQILLDITAFANSFQIPKQKCEKEASAYIFYFMWLGEELVKR